MSEDDWLYLTTQAQMHGAPIAGYLLYVYGLGETVVGTGLSDRELLGVGDLLVTLGERIRGRVVMA